MHCDNAFKESCTAFFPSTSDFPGETSLDADVEFFPSEDKKKKTVQ